MPFDNGSGHVCMDFACQVAADITDRDEDFFKGCCGVIEADPSHEQIAGFSFITEIIDAIFAVIDRCRNFESFQTAVKNQNPFVAAYFRRRAFSKPKYEIGEQVYTRRELATKMLDHSAAISDQVLQAAWQEVYEPDVSPF